MYSYLTGEQARGTPGDWAAYAPRAEQGSAQPGRALAGRQGHGWPGRGKR
jgi:hypothetical protein